MTLPENPWKFAVVAALVFALAATVGLGALRGLQSYQYLNTVIGTVGDKPITRANYLDLQLAREAAAAQPKTPAPAKDK
jgi:hypothetical protein